MTMSGRRLCSPLPRESATRDQTIRPTERRGVVTGQSWGRVLTGSKPFANASRIAFMLIIGHSVGWELYGEKNKPLEKMRGSVDLNAHHQNFINAVLNGEKPNAPASIGHISAALCHVTNVSSRLRRTIEIDPKTEQVTNSPEANAMMKRKYRDGHWAVPKGV